LSPSLPSPPPSKKLRRREPTTPARATPVPSEAAPASTETPVTTPSPPAPVPTAPATLIVATAPWCDLRVDGLARGRTPQTLSLPPGHHHIECTNPAAGRSLTRELDLLPGQLRELRERLYGTVRVTPSFTHADAFAVDDGRVAADVHEVEPGRRRITFYVAGKAIATRYIDVPPEGCRLVDVPAAACEKP
jgi:hypothetical protein